MNEQERELDLLVAELEQENRLLRARNERLEREALAAPVQEPVAWMPMNTAPKNGTRILCKNEEEFVDICEWTPCDAGGRFTSSDDRTFGHGPTYISWQPLPPASTPPAAQPAPVQEPHPDDMAVDCFAAAMKAKMAKQRAKGYGGWDSPDQCPAEWLKTMLAAHIAKGDPVDVGNFAMMLWNRGESTTPPAAPVQDDHGIKE